MVRTSSTHVLLAHHLDRRRARDRRHRRIVDGRLVVAVVVDLGRAAERRGHAAHDALEVPGQLLPQRADRTRARCRSSTRSRG